MKKIDTTGMSKDDIYDLVMTFNRNGHCCHLDSNNLVVLDPKDQWQLKQRLFNIKNAATHKLASFGRLLAKLDEK